ncbi:LysR substrate-binding domain-containing protein [Hwanghaeella sp.]|uniref:LysR substrate-binding domain-containing protein n=1 Tax=Hwanghaeella sp. TaxID=2605943 RepID=UPI003CCBED3A
MRITHRQLEAFVQFMEVGTVTGAAERLFVSQPAMSKMLAGLEIDLDLTLFHREKKRLKPTDEAHLLYKEVRRLFASVSDVERFARDLRDFRTGELRIITATSIGHTFVADAAVEFGREFPDVHIKIDTSSSVGSDVLRQNVDLGFSVTQFHHSALTTEAMFHASSVCVLPAGHPLEERDVVKARDLEGEEFVSFTPDSRMRHLTDAVFEQQRVSRKLRFDVFSSAEANALVSKGLGVSIVEPLNVHFYPRPGLVIKRFEPKLEFTFSVMRPNDRGDVALADRFLDILAKHVACVADGKSDLPETLEIRLAQRRVRKGRPDLLGIVHK